MTTPQRRFLFLCLVSFLSLASISAEASFFSNQSHYYHEKDKWNLVFEKKVPIESYKSLLSAVHPPLITEFESPWRNPALIFYDPKDVLSNSWVAFSPRLHLRFFMGDLSIMENYAFSSWESLVLIHELGHIYQHSFINFPLYYEILGAPPLFPFNPNLAQPRFLPEGNSTWNESRFSSGGRLFSGTVRATTLALFKEEPFPWAYLLNEQSTRFPYGREKYYLGGYFFSYLAEHFSEKQAQLFFKQAATHYINPYRLKAIFKEVFGRSYFDIYDDFSRAMTQQARRQVSLDETSETKVKLTRSQSLPRLTKQNSTISFLSRPYINSSLRLNRFHIDKNKLQQAPTKLPPGPVFWVKNKAYSSTKGSTSTRQVQHSLFDKKGRPLEKFNGQHVFDMTKGHHVFGVYLPFKSYIKSTKSTTTRFKAHSTALVNAQGDVFYFKSENNNRVLYKNHKALASFKGFFSKISDLGPQGEVYFIAATPTGSSLYSYEKGALFRLSRADTLVNAKAVKNNHFLVTEVTPSGYHTILIEAVKFRQVPAHYSYKWKSFPDPMKSVHSQNKQPSKKGGALTSSKSKYSPFKNLKHSLLVNLTSSDAVNTTLFNLSLNDPLRYLKLSYFYKHENLFLGHYRSNTLSTHWNQYRIKAFSAVQLENRSIDDLSKDNLNYALGLHVPFKKGRRRLDLGLLPLSKYGGLSYQGAGASYSQTLKTSPLDFYPQQHFSLSSLYMLSDFKNPLFLSSSWVQNLYRNTYLLMSAKKQPYLDVKLFSFGSGLHISNSFTTYIPHVKYSLSTAYVKNLDLYFKVFPISFPRSSLELGLEGQYFESPFFKDNTQATLTLNNEVVFLHNTRINIKLGLKRSLPESWMKHIQGGGGGPNSSKTSFLLSITHFQ